MTFAGAKLLFVLLGFVIGFASTAVLFLITYNLFIDPANSSAKGWTIALLVISFIIGLILVFLFYKFLKDLAIPIVAALAGAFGFYMIYQVTGVGN